MSTFLLRRPVDWSLLTNGFHIPTKFHLLVYAMPGGELHHGDKRGVKILIDGEVFEAHHIIHKEKPVFDRPSLSFHFPNGLVEKVKIDKPLKA